MVVVTFALAGRLFSRTPHQMGLEPDGEAPAGVNRAALSPSAPALPGSRLWRDVKFLTLAVAMALGLFAQIGLIAHLFSLLVPSLGENIAGLAMGLATACAIAGRTLLGWLMPVGADRRLYACLSYGVQIAGSFAFLLAAGTSVPLLLAGVVLFGLGIGNATSLPPLIAQVEFAKEDVQRVVSLIVATAQSTYAFAPAAFGLIREIAPVFGEQAAASAPIVFLAAALIQALAIGAFLLGRWPRKGAID
jgi:Major Facilitator Superfamily